ncbi:MAG: hypothetical protein WBN90_09530, partial [Gammaproteobacteria bacterium]
MGFKSRRGGWIAYHRQRWNATPGSIAGSVAALLDPACGGVNINSAQAGSSEADPAIPLTGQGLLQRLQVSLV